MCLGHELKCSCAWHHQGVRSEKVGVIDAEYILHKGIPSLGGPRNKNVTTAEERKQYKNSLRSKVSTTALCRHCINIKY
jgi:hypothetical protein